MTRFIALSMTGMVGIFVACVANGNERTATRGPALFAANVCEACHHLSEMRIGPPLQAIAIRYSQNAAAAQFLPYKIIYGGAGNWGPTAMVPHEQLSYEEACQLTDWILSLAPHG